MLSRRSFLKGLAVAGIAVAAPALVLPSPRTIISPGASLFLPPTGGWLPQGKSLPMLVTEVGIERQRMISLRVASGAFKPGSLVALRHVGPDGTIRVLEEVVVGNDFSSEIALRTLSRATSGLEVAISSPLTANGLPFRKDVQVVRLHEQAGWAGDFMRYVNPG